MKNGKVELVGIRETVHPTENGIVIVGEQDIPDHFLDSLADKRAASINAREGEFMHVADIPMAVVAKWRSGGFDLLSDRNITPAMIVAKLKQEDMGKLLATTKRV